MAMTCRQQLSWRLRAQDSRWRITSPEDGLGHAAVEPAQPPVRALRHVLQRHRSVGQRAPVAGMGRRVFEEMKRIHPNSSIQILVSRDAIRGY
jgi:hypothetical protein